MDARTEYFQAASPASRISGGFVGLEEERRTRPTFCAGQSGVTFRAKDAWASTSRTMLESQLSIGFLEGFRQEDTLLLLGQKDSLARLAGALREMLSHKRSSLPITELEFVRVYGAVRLVVRLAGENQTRGCIAINRDNRTLSFTWILDEEACLEIVEKIMHLAACSGPGHQELSTGDVEDVLVVASKDEYDSSIFQVDLRACQPPGESGPRNHPE